MDIIGKFFRLGSFEHIFNWICIPTHLSAINDGHSGIYHTNLEKQRFAFTFDWFINSDI
jgi:hypothetical protein